MIGIAKDEPKRLKATIEKHKVAWPQLLTSENGNLVDTYKGTGFPTNVLLDKTGKIIAINLQPDEIEKAMERQK